MKPHQSLLLFCFIIGSLTIMYFQLPGWIDADTYGFYNQTCNNQFDLETPIISKAFFHSLPCDPIAWKVIGFFLIFCIFSSFYWSAKRLELSVQYLWAIGLSGFLVAFLWSPEDDVLAYPIIVVSSVWLLSKITWKKIISYGVISVFLTIFVWKGAIIPMGIIGLGAISPLLSIIPVLFLSIGFFDRWGNSSEAIWGAGSLVNNFIVLPLLFVLPKWSDDRNIKTWVILGSMMVLSFFQPKWGEYVVIPAFVLLVVFHEKLFQYKHLIAILGIAYLIIFTVFIMLIIIPTNNQWEVMRQAVIIQEKGGIIYNDWGVGHYFEYIGGVASAKGGYHGEQSPVEPVFFWLGFDQNFIGYDCHHPIQSLAEGDGLLLLRCQVN